MQVVYVPERDTRTSISLIMSNCSIGLFEKVLIVLERVTSGTSLSSATTHNFALDSKL